MPEATFNKAVCDGHCPKFIIAAYKSGSIYLHDNWDPSDVWQASYLVHEMMHYMQDQAGMHPATPTCQDAWRLELQAYELQNRCLLQYQKNDTASNDVAAGGRQYRVYSLISLVDS